MFEHLRNLYLILLTLFVRNSKIFMIRGIKFAIFLIICLFLFGNKLNSQLTLQKSIEIARERSDKSIIAQKSYFARKFRYDAYKADLYPQLILSGETPGLVREINPITQPDGTQQFRRQSQLFSTGQISLFQKIPLTNTRIYLSSGISRIDMLGTSNTSLWRASPIQLMLVQPIFQFNSQRWELEIEELRHRASDNRFAEDMEDLSMSVSQRFFDLYISNMNLQNAQFNERINDTLLVLSRGRFNVGKIAENDLLQNELAYMNAANEVERASLDYQRALQELKDFIGYDDITDIEPPLTIPEFEINEEAAIEFALNNRSSFNDFEVEKRSAERILAQVRSENSLNAEISASYGMNQSALRVPDAYRNLLDQERLNLSLSIPIFQWGKGSSRIQAAMEDKERIEREIESRRKSMELDIVYQIRQFKMLQRQVELSRIADTIASRRFDVAKNRYLIGTIDMNTLFIAQSEKDAAFRNYIQTLRNFWVGFYNIRRLTLYDFQDRKEIKYEIIY